MSLLLPQLNLADNQLCGLDPWGHGTYTSEGIEAIAGALKAVSYTHLRAHET